MASLRRLAAPVHLVAATLLVAGTALASPLASSLEREASRPPDPAAALLQADRNDEALEVLLDAGRLDEAFDLLASEWRFDEALDLKMTGPDADARRARVLSFLGQRDDERAFATALAKVAGQPPARARAFLSALWPARIGQAQAAWSWLVKRGGATSADETLVRVQEILDPARESKDAAAVLAEGATLLAGASPCGQALLGAGLLDLARARGRDDAALAIAKTWVATTDLPAASGALGDLHRRASRFAEAAAAYGHAADLQPGESAARWMQADMLTQAGDVEGAAAARRLAETIPAQICSRLRLANAMDATGARDGAVVMRRDAFAEERANAGGRTVAQLIPLVQASQAAELDAMAQAGDVDAALALSEHAVAPFLARLDATADLVAALRAADRASEADALLARVSDVVIGAAIAWPESSRMQNARAWLAARTGTDLADGLLAAERAVELAPASAGILDTLAEIRFQSGDRAGALEAGRRALELQPGREYFQRQVERFAKGVPSTRPPIELE